VSVNILYPISIQHKLSSEQTFKNRESQCCSPVSKAGSCRVTIVVNPTVGCLHFLPGLLLPSQLQRITALGRHQFIVLGEQRYMCENNLLRVAASQWRERELHWRCFIACPSNTTLHCHYWPA